MKEFYMLIEVIQPELAELLGRKETLPWIDISVYRRTYSKFICFKYNVVVKLVSTYQLQEGDEDTSSWVGTLNRNKTMLKFNNTLDLDTFLEDNGLVKYAIPLSSFK